MIRWRFAANSRHSCANYLFDIAFCWLFGRWIGHPWSSAQWMLAMIMSALALVSAFICVKLAPKSHPKILPVFVTWFTSLSEASLANLINTSHAL
jgi:hypothetical protein